MTLLILLFACTQSGVLEPVGPGGTSEPPIDSGIDTDIPPVTGDEVVLTVDAIMPLMIHVSWDPSVWPDASIEYRFEGGDWLTAPAVAPGLGVIIGVPELTAVDARLTSPAGASAEVSATTGEVPSKILLPVVEAYDPALAFDADYAMISVASGEYTFEGPYFIQIFDRQGRIVWFHQVPGGLFSFYPSVAFDGTHLWFDHSNIFGFASGSPGVTRRTLDGRSTSTLSVPGMGQAVAEGPDDSFFVERRGARETVDRLHPDGTLTEEWDCEAWSDSLGIASSCGMNATTWDEARDTILVSFFETSTVVEIDRATGQPIRQMGQLTAGDPYTFDPPGSVFAYQHAPYWTPEGTLLVSTHASCVGVASGCSDNFGQDGVQIAAEYEVDDATKTLTQIASNVSTDLWATQVGEAYRLPNGNLIQGFGQDGAVREYAPDGTIAWEVQWPKDNDDYRVVGHVSLIPDLYALNVGTLPSRSPGRSAMPGS